MNNWKTDFKVKFHLEYHHKDGTKEKDYNSLIVHAEDEDAAKKMILNPVSYTHLTLPTTVFV